MRIAMLCEAWEPIWGGGQAHVFELSKKLAQEHDCLIDIYTMNLPDVQGETQPLTMSFEAEQIRVIRCGKQRNFHSFLDRILWIWEATEHIRKHHAEKKYDLIHAHANLPGITGKLLSKKLHIPIVYTVHGSNLLDLGKKNIHSLIENILYTKIHYDTEITVSQGFLKYKNNNKAIYIPNGVDQEKFDRATKSYGNQKIPGVFTIIFIGRFDPVKGIDLLIRALAPIKNALKKRGVRVRLTGYGYEKSRLQELSQELDLGDLITFNDQCRGEAVLREYATADLFVLPSRSEGFPLTILEAWAAKLPVIATAVGEIPNIIEDGHDGFIIPPDENLALSAVLLRAISDENLKNIGLNGYQKALEKYQWKNTADQTYEIYQALLQ